MSIKCLMNGLEVNYPCSPVCALFGDCVTAFEAQKKENVRTNADRIRAMSDEELAVWMTLIRIDTINEICKIFDVKIEMPLPTVENTADVCDWLKQPAE